MFHELSENIRDRRQLQCTIPYHLPLHVVLHRIQLSRSSQRHFVSQPASVGGHSVCETVGETEIVPCKHIEIMIL